MIKFIDKLDGLDSLGSISESAPSNSTKADAGIKAAFDEVFSKKILD